MNKIRYFALCLVIITIFSMFGYLFGFINKIDNKLDAIRQGQLLESEKTASGIEGVMNTIANMIVEIETLLKAIEEHDNRVITAISENGETEPTEQPTEPTIEPTVEPPKNESPKEECPSNYYGRLVIPDAGISVGLYHGADPAITDREDSANLFSMRVFDGLYIADHNNQEFSKLYRVTVGMRGYIRTADGTVFNIICTDVLNGHNNGKIVDEDGNTNFDAHFLMYTCRDHWTNILICLWKHC